MTKDFKKRIQALWKRKEREYGIKMPPEFRDYFTNKDAFDYEDTEDTNLEESEGLIDEFFQMEKALRKREKAAGYFPPCPKPSSTRKRYQRCFEKRFHLVDFVIDQTMPLREQGPFTHNKRFNWKWLCSEWNAAHPYDPMNKEALKVAYYRAVAEEDIQREYLDRLEREYRGHMEAAMANVAASMKLAAVRTEGELKIEGKQEEEGE